MSRGILAFSLAVSLTAVAAPASAMAQERVAPTVRTEVRFVRAPGGRIGVYLEAGCAIESNARGDCDQPPRVRAVVDGSPADVAGILAGDTLLALDGVSLRSEQGRRSLSRLRAGIPIEIEVGRKSGRSTLRAIPSSHEGGAGVRSASGELAALGAAPRAGFNVIRFRDDSGEITEFQFGPDSGSPPDASGWVVFSPDAAGSLQVHVGEGDYAALLVDGESVMLTELEDHLVELSENLQEGVREIELNVSVDQIGEGVRRHLILENPELASRLQRIRAESLAAAREQLDLLVERRSELESRGEIPPPYAYRFRAGVPEAPVTESSRLHVGPAAGLSEMSYRLGGAEFRELTPDLAEYFGVTSGLLVLRVIPETPIATLGLREGDVVVEVGGRKSPDMLMFRQLAVTAEHTDLEVKWIRKGTMHTGQLSQD